MGVPIIRSAEKMQEKQHAAMTKSILPRNAEAKKGMAKASSSKAEANSIFRKGRSPKSASNRQEPKRRATQLGSK